MKFTIFQTCNKVQFNALGFDPVNPVDREVLYESFTRNSTGGGAFTLSILTDKSTTPDCFDIQVDALKANGEVYLSRTLTNVPMYVNCKTTYSGTFFTGTTSGAFVTDNNWTETDPIEY